MNCGMRVSREAIQTDVLILGGGGAGLCSAIAAAEAGASVLVVSKAGGNSTVMAAGGFAVALEGAGDSTACFVSDALRSGAGLADVRLLTRLAEEAPRAIETLTQWGVTFYCREDGSYRLFRSGGHSHPRSLRCASGRGADAYRVMLQQAKSLGVHFIGNALITELLRKDGRVVGAAGMDREGAPLFLLAKAVVLATGGMAALYEHTTNTPGLTGEGYILARQAGCRLRDLEFVQFMPTTIAYPPQLKGRLVNDTLRGEGARLLNANSDRFMKQYDAQLMENSTRDVISAAIAAELAAGRGTLHGGVYLDARHISPEALSQSFGYAAQMAAAGVDPAQTLMEVVPAAHFSCGGVVIDEGCRTGVEGLFAVGEVTGGIHGANRLGATALTENAVFGAIAGRAAAQDADRAGEHPLWVESQMETALKQTDQPQNPALNAVLAEGKKELGSILWHRGGILRNAEGLAAGLEELSALENALAIPPEGDFSQTIRALNLHQLITLGKLILRASLERKESRGCLRRTDYPKEDASWNHSIFQ